MKGKYKVNFDAFIVTNRWKRPHYSRPSDFVLIGISKGWFSPNDFNWKLSFFGIDICFWFKRTFIK